MGVDELIPLPSKKKKKIGKKTAFTRKKREEMSGRACGQEMVVVCVW